MTWRKTAAITLAICLALGPGLTAQADLITNGGFELSDNGNGQVGLNTNLVGWSVPTPPGSYTFLYAPGTADTIGANGEYGNVSLWGPGNGIPNGLPATSPAGGNFIAQDGDFQQGAISQTINGLTAGDQYTVGFWWAGAQQTGFAGASSDQWQVSLGAQTQLTPVVNVPSQGFSGWMYDTLTFTADNTSDVLSFLATSTPSGVPPFALLDGVTMTNGTPEPASITLSLLAFGAFGGVWGFKRMKRPIARV
jgi:hypothetical protein